MERKEFLITSGMLLTATMLSTCALASDNSSQANINNGIKRRPEPDQFKQPILKAITLGLNAPNPHNTQAWKFRILNDTEALFYVDEKKILPATDPPARQIHVGCGCFIALFRIGAGSLGFEGKVEYLPDGEYGFMEIGKKPIARLSVVSGSQQTDPLHKQIYPRQTNRTPYHGPLLTTAEFENVLKLTKASYAGIKLVNKKEELIPMLELLYKGMEVECYDWNAYDESRQWFRVKDDIETKRDGINLRVNGVKGIKRWFAEMMLSDYSKKAWHNEGSIQSYLRTHYDAVMSSKGIVAFITNSNRLMDWFRCGEDYARFQLAAYDQGFYIHPLSQVLQEFDSMKPLYDEFNKMIHVSEPAKVQMVVRIGRGEATEYAYRRNTEDLIVKEEKIQQP